jgi:hypothetical protein
LRQHPVGNDDVELPALGLRQAGAPGGGVLNGVTALAQSLDEKARRFSVILDEQGVHGATA